MDFERLIKGITEKTAAVAENTGDEENPEYTLTLKIEDDRSQDIIIYPFEEDGVELVRLITPIGDKKEFTPNKMLSFLDLNMSLRFGAFAAYQGKIVLSDTVKYSSVVDIDKVTEQIQYLSKMADQFERTLIGLDRG